jgi:hypothetical protein
MKKTIVPDKIDPDDYNAKREVPSSAWDAFTANGLDRKNLREDYFSAIRGHWATNIPMLPLRLNYIGTWISNIAYQPASVWWAASQNGLHPDIQQLIKRKLERSQKDVSPIIRQGWRYLFEAWDEKSDDFYRDWYELKAVIYNDGWDSTTVRKYAFINRPYLEVKQDIWRGPKPPEEKEDIRVSDLLQMNIKYLTPPNDVKIPDEWLALAIRELRKNLEHALQLETEIGGYGLSNISPIVPDDRKDVDHYGRTHGLSGSVISFSSHYSRLIKLNVSIARQELAAWPIEDDTIFSRLRIWASGQPELVSAQAFAQIINGLSNAAFWDSYHRRDLLLVLAKRWDELQDDSRKEIEERLLKGPAKWEGEKDHEYEERKAWELLNCITWLANNGCNFTFNLKTETKRLQSIASEWKLEYAAKAANSMEGRGGLVRMETEYSFLLHEPLSSILSKARESSGRTEDFLVRKDPFEGLSVGRPVLAFSALNNAARRNEYPEWAWNTFLNSEARRNDKPKLSALIAERIFRFPNKAVVDFIYPASCWLLNTSKQMASLFPESFEKVISKLINVSRLQPLVSSTSTVRGNKDSDWSLKALNAPIGKIAQALFNDSRINGLTQAGGFPDEWLAYVEKLLSLDGDLRRYAIVIFSHNINWFYFYDPNWTENNLLSTLDKNNVDDQNAFWSGFFWSAKVPNQKLYMLMKPSLLAIAKKRNLIKYGYCNILSGMILADALLNADEDFRSHFLWQVERHSEINENDTGEEWSKMLLELLRDVWPRQKSVKTPTMSAKLFSLTFSNAKCFPEIAEIILPLLTTIDSDHMILPNLRKSKDNIVDLYPHQTLALLHAVLPENVIAWPYNIGVTLHRISEADSSLNSEKRLIELKRKWNSR